jgi:hypothetical protein
MLIEDDKKPDDMWSKADLTFRIAMRVEDQPPGALSEYREFLAPAQLADRFLCFWTQTIVGSQGTYEHRVLPDACIDIVSSTMSHL